MRFWVPLAQMRTKRSRWSRCSRRCPRKGRKRLCGTSRICCRTTSSCPSGGSVGNISTLPPEGQEEVVRHLTNLLPDQDYGLMRSFLTNSSLSENVLDFLLDDVLDRKSTR